MAGGGLNTNQSLNLLEFQKKTQKVHHFLNWFYSVCRDLCIICEGFIDLTLPLSSTWDSRNEWLDGKKSPGRYLTSFLDLTKNVGLSEGLFSGRLRHSRDQKIWNFGLWRPKKSRNLEKAEKLSKMSCFVMAFSGVLQKNQVIGSQKIACGAIKRPKQLQFELQK